MRRSGVRWGILLFAVLAALVPSVVPLNPTAVAVSAPAAQSQARIMVLGDSISQGSAGDYTWRHRLFRQLTAAGVETDLVGPRDDLYDNVANVQGDHSYADPDFDTDHDAIWGQSIATAKQTIEAEVRNAEPDYLLVLLGINDLSFTTDAAQTEANLRLLLANARAGKPTVRIALGTVLPNQRSLGDTGFAAQLADYNNRVTALAPQLSTPDSPIVVAPTAKDVVVGTDLYDGTHPNARGEYKIAAAFADTLAATWGVGTAFPRPLPSVAVGPLVEPVLTVSARDGAAVLSWTPSPGATGYWVWTRQAGVGEFTRLPIPLPLSSNPWTAGLLTNGTAYEFKLQTTKADDVGVFSNVATATPDGPAPIPPSDLAATTGNGSAVLTWTPAAGATGYYVWTRNITAGETTFTRLPFPVTGNSWTAELLVNGGTYEFKLQPVNGGVQSGFSNTVQVRPSGPAPGGASGLSVANGDGRAVLSWTPAANATAYNVWTRNVSGGEAEFSKLPFPVSGSTWTAGLLVNGGTYEFKLQSVNGLVEGGFTPVVQARPTGPTPGAVANLTAANGNRQAVLSWTPAANATAYNVWTRDVSGGEAEFSKLPFPVSGNTWTAAQLVNGGTYEFKLQSVNGLIQGAFSAVVQVRPTGPTPGGVSGLTVANRDGQARLSWTAAPNATGYYVWTRNVTAGEAGFSRLPYPVDGTSWLADLLANGGVYEFKLQSINGLIEGGFSAVVQARPTGPAPGAPSLTITAGNRKAALSWVEPANASSYYIWTRNVTAGEGFSRLPYPVTGSAWTAEQLVNGATYEFKVQAYNDLIAGGTSAAVAVTPHGPPAPGPSSLSARSANHAAVLSWNEADQATGYYVWTRNATAGEGFSKLPFPVSGGTWTASLLVNGATYEFKLQSVDGLQPGGYSNTVSVKPLGPTPQGPADLSLSAGFGQATLHWSRTSTASTFMVQMRDVTAGQSFTELPYPVSGTSWTASLLVPKHTYEFRLLAVSDLQRGNFSNTAQATLPKPPSVTGVRSVPGPNSISISWNPVPGADNYTVYMGYGQSEYCLPPTLENMRVVQWGLTGTSWRHDYLPGGCYWYLVAANKNGVDGAVTFDMQSMTQTRPKVRTNDHFFARAKHFDNPPLSTSKRVITRVAPEADRGIVIGRGFIIADDFFNSAVGDGRSFSSGATASARLTVAWDTSTGEVSVTVQKSCVPFCHDALPIRLGPIPYQLGDWDLLDTNYVNVTKWSGGRLKVDFKATDSWTGVADSTLPWWFKSVVVNTRAHLDGSFMLTPQNAGYRVELTADRYPAYEFYRYPRYSTFETDVDWMGTRGQTSVNDLQGSAQPPFATQCWSNSPWPINGRMSC